MNRFQFLLKSNYNYNCSNCQFSSEHNLQNKSICIPFDRAKWNTNANVTQIKTALNTQLYMRSLLQSSFVVSYANAVLRIDLYMSHKY